MAAATLASLSLLATTVFAAHSYDIEVSHDLETMTVEARFDRAVDRISARSQDAVHFLRAAEDCDSGESLESRSRYLSLPIGGIRCLRYTVDLGSAARAERISGLLDNSNLIASAVDEQSTVSAEAAENINVIMNISGENINAVAENTEAATHIATQASGLSQAIAKFKV